MGKSCLQAAEASSPTAISDSSSRKNPNVINWYDEAGVITNKFFVFFLFFLLIVIEMYLTEFEGYKLVLPYRL